MNLLQEIAHATEHHPAEVARRRRVLNIASWMAGALTGGFAISQSLSGTQGTGGLVAANAGCAIIFLLIPLLHRFGHLVASVVLGVVAYAAIFIICGMVGTDTGMQMQYLVAMAIMIVILGTESLFIPLCFGVAAGVLIIALELVVPPDTGIQPRQEVFLSFLAGVTASCAILFSIVFYALRDTARAQAAARREHERSETLLLNILPFSVAERLKTIAGATIADKYDDASILFADMAGFTARASDTSPEELVSFLNRVFTDFDRLVEQHGLEKIKTTGDAYMVVSGVPVARHDHAEALANFALEMRDNAIALRDPHERHVPFRIGMASGPVVAGVVGTRKIFYDVWGDAVNVASRMESTDEEGKIQVSPEVYERLREKFVLERRGPVRIKGKGEMVTWILAGRKSG